MVTIVLTLIIRFAGVNGPWLRRKLGISVLIEAGPAAKIRRGVSDTKRWGIVDVLLGGINEGLWTHVTRS